MFLWLHFEGLGTVKCSTAPDGSVELTLEAPNQSYEIAELGGAVEVEHGTPLAFTPLIGRPVTDVPPLVVQPQGIQVGFVLTTGADSVALLNIGDDLEFGTWPGTRWTSAGIEVLC
jgi:hypothetical protein